MKVVLLNVLLILNILVMIFTLTRFGAAYQEFQSMKQSLTGIKTGLHDLWDLSAGGVVSKGTVIAKYGNSIKDKLSKFWTKDLDKDEGL
ncbi:hypothetical protein KAU11_11500 [Candidatus Babeliales bacterium]|nr:hypothetical protein [Candidatus Babeliales bacterium]